MINDIDKIGYSLSKHVPDMLRGFTIQTNYGELVIDAADAAPFAAMADRLLEKKYLAAMQEGKKP